MNRPHSLPSAESRHRPGVDILRLPLVGSFLRWRWSRLSLQLLLLLVAALVVYDGFTGPQVASQNIATVVVWIHYRGLVVLALLLAGNLFCMSCPFTLPRTVARRFSRGKRRWPRILRNKWPAIAAFVLFLVAYEWFDLWASPLLTAWIVVAYFAAAFVLEATLAESPFCKYLCPVGTFNFLGSTLSPLQVTVADRDVCRTCPGSKCVNGSGHVSGCGTELFPPEMSSNLDCTFCLDCARACPYDNVALAGRSPRSEAVRPAAWPRRRDLGLLALVFAFAALGNAFGMVPPFHRLLEGLGRWLPGLGEGLILLVIFGVIDLLLPALLGLAAAITSRRLAGNRESVRVVFARHTAAFVPLAFAVWLAHYGFHFATGALTLIPVMQSFLLDHGVAFLGEPDWSLSALLPGGWLLPLQILVTLAGLAASLYAVRQRARRQESPFLALLPWIGLLLMVALLAIYLFSLPMEMRGTGFMD